MQHFAVKVTRLVIAATAILGACKADDPAHARRDTDYGRNESGAGGQPPAVSPAERVGVLTRVEELADSTDKKLRRVPNLTRAEKSSLLRDVNAVQIARARRMGVPRGSRIEEMTRSGRLVKLADTTEYWIIRELDYSVPSVTPATEAMLAEIGERFQARLDSLGLPRYRLDITSVMRTPEKQSALRKRNANASRVESSHEFGTTVDIAYRKYAPPARDSVGTPLDPATRQLTDSLIVHVAQERAAEMQAILGRVILEMRRQGLLLVRMERRQTVYHITVARALPKRPRVSAL